RGAGGGGGGGGGRGGRDNKPFRRPNMVRVSNDVARRVRDGHPWVYRDAMQGRQLSLAPGKGVDIVDPSGGLCGRALYEPEGTIALRVFAREPSAELDGARVAAVIERAAQLRRTYVDTSEQACFRAVAGDSEGLPAINVDVYAGHHVVTMYSGIAEIYLDDVVAALQSTWSPRSIYLQRRHIAPEPGKARSGAELLAGEAAPAEVIVVEHGVRYVVDVSAPLSVGLFPDMRRGRAAVQKAAPGLRVLNCFSYTGAFSVVAALAGASTIVSVDTASRAHQRARRNFSENEIDIEGGGRDVRFVTGDTFATCARFASRGEHFDLVILDPPTFSSAKGGRPFTALKDYAELTQAALEIVAPGGLLCAASNAAKLDAVDLERALARGGALAKRELLITDRLSQPPDFPQTPGFSEASYLKLYLVHVR
ncbi:MAG: class I SAM-dependent rRNA methyltransferase, partial [Myxococcales bacterium]|nr:class I SAM-dependent rRNA methyltransferase [Myxococcales bacterium]